MKKTGTDFSTNRWSVIELYFVLTRYRLHSGERRKGSYLGDKLEETTGLNLNVHSVVGKARVNRENRLVIKRERRSVFLH